MTVEIWSGQKVRAYAIYSRAKQCLNKRGYTTKGQAERVMAKQRKSPKDYMTYECPHCFMWHWGKMNDAIKQRIADVEYNKRVDIILREVSQKKKALGRAMHNNQMLINKLRKLQMRRA